MASTPTYIKTCWCAAHNKVLCKIPPTPPSFRVIGSTVMAPQVRAQETAEQKKDHCATQSIIYVYLAQKLPSCVR